MSVEIRLPTILRPAAGGESSVALDGGTVGSLVDGLVEKFPAMKAQLLSAEGGLHKFVNLYKNDEDIRYLEALNTEVSDGDVVSILPAVAGG